MDSIPKSRWQWITSGFGLFKKASPKEGINAEPAGDAERSSRPVEAPTDPKSLVQQMLDQNRFALLLREQLIDNLDEEQLSQALELHEDHMALVPEGEVVLGRLGESMEVAAVYDDADQGDVVRVETMYIDRYPVTNRQYHYFVSGGGYSQMALWDPEIWPAVLDFVDSTGQPGPKYWTGGRYAKGEDEFPVVGVSAYEAAAYARWAGKRLPTDAEWVKAGSWPVRLSETNRLQRRYPWGDSMDRAKANLWGSGSGVIVSVHEFEDGVSVGGAYQLIGNVWEWTASKYEHHDGRKRDGENTLVSLRGGAFDTYFDNHATCDFQSGDHPMSRKYNIGFRCALSACDVARSPLDPALPKDLEEAQDDVAVGVTP
ncbi:MAG: SUMF1/EgtB/PvdO family nonheme iron enzyme [Planctomycetes bacterium]|nr:SUMF1/EgtB/PvdO family nonheme iron enzyme [Planctomycetota bacterium]